MYEFADIYKTYQWGEKFIKNIIINCIKKEIDNIEEQLDVLGARVEHFKRIEKGKLGITNRRSGVQYYIRMPGSNPKYLKKKEKARLKMFMQNYYDLYMCEGLTEFKTGCLDFLKLLEKYQNLSAQLPPCVLENVELLPSDIEKDAEKWENLGKRHLIPDNDHRIQTLRGDFVRSKSECLIADRLYLSGLHYRYEEELCIEFDTYYPDFMIMNPINDEIIIWEHFGKMDNPNYLGRAIKKIDAYSDIGYSFGKNFIATVETADWPLNNATVENNIMTVFGCASDNGE